MADHRPGWKHAVVWAAAAASALVVVVAGLLPGFTAGIGAFVGAGNDQRLLPPFERTFTLLGYGHPRYLAAFAAAIVVIPAAAWGWRRANAWLPAAVILAAAVAGLSLTSAALRESNGAFGGVFLADAVQHVISVAESSREARNPAFGTSGYTARAEIGWWLTQGALYVLLLLSSAALGRRIQLVWPVAVGLIVAATVLVFAVPGENCGGEPLGHDPNSNPLGLLAVFASLACSGLGVGALSRREWTAGTLMVTAGLLAAVVGVFVLAFKDCAFY